MIRDYSSPSRITDIIDPAYYNSLDIGSFALMLKDPSYCYKFYWLEAIVKLISRDVKDGKLIYGNFEKAFLKLDAPTMLEEEIC